MAPFAQLAAQIRQAMTPDRQRLMRMLRAAQEAQRNGKPSDRNLQRLTEELSQSLQRIKQRQAGVPAIRYTDDLPIVAARDQILAAIKNHQVVIVCGQTGSGKSTQLPKMCLELGRGVAGLIGHTQPRRIAARSIASRLAEELGVSLGREVGFKIRFSDQTGPQAYIKLMTDGILLAETRSDRFLDQYDTLIIDEAHERSLNIDFILGFVKRLLPKRPDLKVVITSATIDAARFSEHFGTDGPAPVIEVSGRTYPVDILYRPIEPDEDSGDPDWLRGVLGAIDEVSHREGGDVLVFLPTERDILEASKSLRGRLLPGDRPGRPTEVLPLYARLSAAEQNRVFQPHSGRRIVLATNVAESSLTVPRIRYVIDTGTARIARYSPRSKVQRLPIEAISQASANQRAGRCGRVGPGVCIRLYSEEDYLARERFTPPEIQRTNLAAVILQTLALQLGPLEVFPFLDPPKAGTIRDGYQTLFELGAIDDQGQITELGQRLAQLPVDPRVARMIVAGDAEGCLHEILILAAALEIQDPRDRPLDKQQAADECHAQFLVGDSDFMGLLKLWDFYHELRRGLSHNKLRKACRQNFLSNNRMQEWLDVYRQLLELAAEVGLVCHARRDDPDAIHRALLAGYLSSVAALGDNGEYTVAGGQKAVLWPGSALAGKKPKWIVAAEVVETSRRYLRTAARIRPEWIEPLAGHLVRRSYSGPHWDADSGSAVAYEKVSLFGLAVVPRRKVRYGPIDPAKSRELLIRHGLVEGELPTAGKFLLHNRQLFEEALALQTKTRRRDLIFGDDVRYEFYDRRLPPDVYDAPRFESWRRQAETVNPGLLFMTLDELLDPAAKEIDPADFPDEICISRLRLPLQYALEPGTVEDGVTVVVPQEALNQLDPQRLGWLVPGLLECKIAALVKSLPKELRRQLVPARDVARRAARELKFGEGSFTAAVAEVLSRVGGCRITPADFQEDKLPDFLRMNVRVIDDKGDLLAAGRDLAALQRQLGATAAQMFSKIDDPRWTRDGCTTWDFGDLPAQVELLRGGLRLVGYPAVIDQGASVGLRLLDTPPRAELEMRRGVLRLCYLAAKRELTQHVGWLPRLDQLLLWAASLGQAQTLQQQLAERIAEQAFLCDGPLPRTGDAFNRCLTTGRGRLSGVVQEVAGVVTALLQEAHQACVALHQATAPQMAAAVLDLRRQLAALAPSGFLATTPWKWLRHYPRYFKAVQLRLEKLGRNLARDAAQREIFDPLWEAYAQRAAKHAAAGRLDSELTHYRWMLEEFRVSLFAQELGTALPVSVKRLAQQWEKVPP